MKPEIGKLYNLWRDGEYIGQARFVDDVNIGKNFIRKVIFEDQEINEVCIADKWEMIG